MHTSAFNALRTSSPLAFIVLAVAAPSLAQSTPLWQELDQDLMPRIIPSARFVQAGDLNGDGKPDVLFGMDGQNRLFLNNTPDGFTEATATHLPQTLQDTSALLLFDADNDGDLDLVEGRSAQQNLLYTNDGAGVFTLSLTFGTQGTTASFAAGDVDGDGDLDFVTGNLTDPDSLGFNNGNGTFTGASGVQFPRFLGRTDAMQFVDIDGDQDLDLITNNRILVNDGTGTFADETASRRPPVFGGGPVSAADIDDDGDLDALVGGDLLINDGLGFFTSPLPRPGFGKLFDVDQDGDVDIASGALSSSAPARTLLLNDGSGQFTDASANQMPFAAQPNTVFAHADFFGGGTNDLLFVSGEIYVNDGGGSFQNGSRRALPPVAARGLGDFAIGDLDGDGDRDLLAGTSETDRVWVNDGTGHYDDLVGAMPSSSTATTVDVALADIDGDGDLDGISLTNVSPSRPKVLINDGTAVFRDRTQSSTPSLPGFLTAAATGDVDGDGDVDLLLAAQSSAASDRLNRLLLNDGSGIFVDATSARLGGATEQSTAAILADFDGDGDLDAFFANGGPFISEQDRLYINDGAGVFADLSLVQLPAGTNRTTSGQAADIDADGDLDLVLGQNETDAAVRILINDGTGSFTVSSGAPLLSAGEPRILVADMEGDGDLDVLLRSFRSMAFQALLSNDGQGNFTDVSAILPTGLDLLPIFADLDADQDADLISRPFNENPRVLTNLTRQIALPLRTRVGGILRYRVHSAASHPTFLVVALSVRTPAISASPIRGLVRVDSIQWVAPLMVPNPSATVDIPLPNDPSVRGIEFFGQSLSVEGPTLDAWHFSGLVKASVF